MQPDHDVSTSTEVEAIDGVGETGETAGADQFSRVERYGKRVEEWLGSLKDEAEQRSPEVLSALATRAKDVAEYFDEKASKARSKTAPRDAPSASPAATTSASVDDELSQDPGASVT